MSALGDSTPAPSSLLRSLYLSAAAVGESRLALWCLLSSIGVLSLFFASILSAFTDAPFPIQF